MGNTATRPFRAAGGSRSQATNPATSSTVTARQSRPRPVRKTNQSFRSCAYALIVFGDRSIAAKNAKNRSTGSTGTWSAPSTVHDSASDPGMSTRCTRIDPPARVLDGGR